jgi:RecQ family ATP-dependent DNA helicase
MADKITLKEIVELKGCSTEEFIRLASEKGITLSEEDRSEVSLAELRVIDPSLAYKLRYKKPERQTAAKQPSAPKEDSESKANGRTTQQTLHSLESLGSSSKEALDTPTGNPDFQKKSLVLEELISMVNYADMMTIEDVHTIRQKWEDCGFGRGKEFKDLYKRYEFTLKNLYSHLSIDSSILEAEYQANLDRKIRICEALESITGDVSIEIVADSLDALTQQWREAGPVDEEDREQINERFKKAKEPLNKRVQVEKPKSVKSAPKEKEAKSPKIRHIGIVKFYDSSKGFGFVVTNNLGLDNDSKNHLEEVFINSTSFVGYYDPDDRDWLVFEVEKSRRGTRAINAKSLSGSKDDLILALGYVGEFAKIKGRDSKGEKVYDQDIVPYVYKSYWTKDDKPREFLSVLIEYVESLQPEKQDEFIGSFLSNEATCLVIESLLQKCGEALPASPIVDTLKEKVVSAVFEGETPNWSKITELTKGGMDISTYYPILLPKLTSGTTISLDKKTFLLHLGYERIRALVRSGEISELPEYFISFLFKNFKDDFSSLFEANDKLSDKERVFWFLADNDFSHISEIDNWDQMIPWIERQDSSIVTPLINGFIENVDIESDDVFSRFSTSVFVKVLEGKDEDEKIQFLQQLPEQLATNIAVQHFAGTEVFDSIIGEQWKSVRASIAYVVFDLESDGENIKEFAFKQEENIRVYQGEEQLKSLLRALKKQDVIVGHKIKDWDLSILKKKGLETNSFVWDTLEIEILLNPCRYAYSLHTQHDAKSDTELADKLFWNQLFRLSQKPDLCVSLSSLLPPSINDILAQLQKPYFEKLFSESSLGSGQLFQELSEISDDLQSHLKDIDAKSGDGKVLIVSPRTLWGKLAQHIRLSFVDRTEGIDYKVLSKDKLSSNPIKDTYLQTILTRFLELSKTPIVANIAQYLRYNHFPDELLSQYVCNESFGSIECCDIDGLKDLTQRKGYSHIYFVGCEMDGRLCQYTLPELLSTSDFISKNCWIPMRMAGANYMIVSGEEQRLLGIKGLPDDVANVWVERQPNGRYQVNYNFNYEDRISKLKKDNTSASIEYVSWDLARSSERQNSIVLVNSTSRGRFVASQNRVGPVSRYRSLYWTIQLKLLQAIHEQEPGTPIVYVLDNSLELPAVESHARQLGFYVPDNGSLARKLEIICKNNNGLLIISKEQFGAVAGLKEFARYVYVWDNLAVDKCRMMWTGKMPFGDEANAEKEEVKQLLAITDATPKTCLLATWPTIEFQNKYIEANNPESRLYVIDPYLDDFGDLAEAWNTGVFSPKLWTSKEKYEADIKQASAFYKDYELSETPKNIADDQRIKEAMEAIRKIFLPAYEWRESQLDALPAVLSKKSDCLVSIPTGGGKSILFQGPALYYSAFTNRLSIVVTPLKALMEDQVSELHNPRLGFYTNVDYLNSDRSQGEVQQIYRKVKGGELALLYVTPERFRSRSFLNALQTRIANDKGLEYFIFDEAHCISQWGQEFRPDYLNVIKWCEELKKSYPQSCITLYSATVTKQIQDAIAKFLPDVQRYGQKEEDYNPIRSHIGMSFVNVANDDNSRIKAIIEYIRQNNIDSTKSRMLVFCRTRMQCELCAAYLEEHMSEFGFSYDDEGRSPIGFFHAGMDADDREDVYQQFKTGSISVLCATKAFGMGMDIPNVHYIVHYSPPSVLEDYLQEVGRAGRKKEDYEAAGFVGDKLLPTICLVSKEDFKKAKELLIKSMLSWSNLNDIRKSILDYIKPLQTIEQTQKTPIVVPQNLWKKDKLDDSYTDFKLGMYWLENMGRIKMGFLCPSHVNVSITDKNVTSRDAGNIKTTANAYKVYDYIKNHYKPLNEGMIQVAINDLRCEVNLGYQAVLNALIVGTKKKWLRLEQDMRCEIAMTRSSETSYWLRHSTIVTLDIIFAAVTKLLSGQKAHKEFVVDGASRKRLLNETLEENKISTKPYTRTTRGGKTITEQYMLWYDGKETKTKNIGLAIAKNYRADLLRKRAKHIFTVLELLPGVKVRSFLDTESKEVKQVISYENSSCLSYIKDLKSDCRKFLKYLDDKNNRLGGKSGRINWADCLIELNLDGKGYSYLDDILHILRVLGYVNSDGLLPIGIEVFTTPESEQPIREKIKPDSLDERVRKDFDLMNKMRKIRLAAMNAFAGKGRSNLNHFISEYFKCVTFEDFFTLVSNYYDEKNPEDQKFIAALQDEAIIKEEEILGEEQRIIYDAPTDEDINVLAGPGSGKTHILTLRCARLIYRENVAPSEILVLAYNRAVVVELRNRLDRLFGSLGLGRSASQIHVHTFSALARVVCGQSLDDVDIKEWEGYFLDALRTRPADVKQILPGIRFVMIDEFQDITQTRLDAMLTIRQIYPGVKFFTIGDKNQSIYGFDKKIDGIPESTSPDYYYKQLTAKLSPHEYTMRTNYRSYPKILKAASYFLKNPNDAPISSKKLQDAEPSSEYVTIVNWTKGTTKWTDMLPGLVEQAKATLGNESRQNRIEDIAIFFRSNDEVYRGYERVSKMNFPDVRIRIQGASGCELYRVREIHAVLAYLQNNSSKEITISGSQTQKELRAFIENLMASYPKWDRFYLDFAYTLILDYLDFVSSEEDNYTFGQMAESIKESTQTDDGQIYKIYDRYEGERIDRKKQLNIILTTMHKVKGLEFDAVIVTPSFASLPFDGRNDSDIDFNAPLTGEEFEELEEERRLQYVAYTRARKILWVYRFTREAALDQMRKLPRQDAKLGWTDKPEIDKFFLSYMALPDAFPNNDYIMNMVAKNDSITLVPYKNKQGKIGAFVKHNGVTIGMLSWKSKVLKQIKSKEINDGVLTGQLSGLFVNEVFVWTKEDTERYDNENNTSFLGYWSDDAISKGFIYVVDFAGYAK